MKKLLLLLLFIGFLTSIYAQTIPYQYGWPRQGSETYGLYNNSPTIADFDKDSSLDISVSEPISSSSPKVNGWKKNGAFLPGWPVYMPFGTIQSSGSNEISAAGDVTGDGYMEIVFGDENGNIYIFNKNGQHVPGSPYFVGATKESATPALADVDNDTTLEIIITTFERSSPNDNAQLHVLKFNGTGFEQLPGFPIDYGYGADASPVVGDLDGDDELEIVFSSAGRVADSIYSKIHAIKLDGTYLSGWPMEIALSSSPGGTPSLYDINNDGNLEIIVRAMPERYGINGVYAFDFRGTLMPNFPFPVESGHPDANVAIADMDGDGSLEFAFGSVRAVDSGKVFVWNSEGELLPNYPQKIYATWVDGSVALADVSGDSLLDVIVPQSKGFIYAFDMLGNLVSGFPLEAENVHVVKGFESSPTLVDIDGDGDMEIFAGSLNKRLYGWDTPGKYTGREWVTFKGNPQRTGGQLYGYRDPPVNVDDKQLPEKFSLQQNYPNPFNPVTNIKFTLPDPRFVTLKIYNVLGKETATLVNENMEAGEHTISFNALSRGSLMPSGIYFYTLSATGGGESFKQTKKMILMK